MATHLSLQVLRRMKLHVEQCRNSTPECKVCKLWQALHRTKNNPNAGGGQHPGGHPVQGAHQRGGGQPLQRAGSMGGMPPGGGRGGGMGGGGGPSPGGRPGVNSAQQEQLRQKLRQLDPAQVKKMLLAHVRSCQNKQCHTCHKLRERIRQSRAQQQQHGMPPGMMMSQAPRGPEGGMMGMGMQGSFNPLVSGFGNFYGGMGGGGGYGASDGGSYTGMGSAGMGGGGFGPGGRVGMGPLSAGRPGEGPRRTKVKQRGRENVTGLAAPSRQKSFGGAGGEGGSAAVAGGGGGGQKFTRVRVKMSGQRPIEKAAKGGGDKRPSQSKKRSSVGGAQGGAAGDEDSKAGAKRQRNSSGGAGKQVATEEDEGLDVGGGIHQVRHATDRPSSDERNRYEMGQLIEVLAPATGGLEEWRLACVRGCNEQGLYTIQYEPAEQNRHKQTGVEWANTRRACMHPDCRTHPLFLAALPVFCDRCKKALMQAPQQRIYYQETEEARERAGSQTCIKLCNTCHGSLRAELKSNGQAGLLKETQKFMPDRTTALQLHCFDEYPVPQRVEGSAGPVMSTEVDDRWVQCEACHKWYHWTCGMFDDTQYTNGRAYYCASCKHLEPQTEQVLESAKNNDATTLYSIPMSEFIEKAVADDLAAENVQCEPITIRVVSCILTQATTPPRLVEHMEAIGEPYPKEFPYKSKALLAFQKRNGLDVCLFALYVQEYGSDCPEPNRDRVYISYLDSVRYFASEPDQHRSTMYHAILVAYLQWARLLGYKHVHIWVEPPKMGDEYIFFARSDQQRKPMKREKLREWYRRMLDKAKAKGVVESYGSMHEHYHNLKTVRDIPLFYGDQWEITVPSLLGIDQDNPAKRDLSDPSKLLRMDSKDVVQKAQQEMHHLKRHFLVVVFAPLVEEPRQDGDKVISSDLTDSRHHFLGTCQHAHWEFSTLRHAQHSTMRILNHIHNKPSYCIDNCKHGGVEDGSFMVGCDNCDGWYHGECVGISKEEASNLECYVCPRCRDVALPSGDAVAGAAV